MQSRDQISSQKPGITKHLKVNIEFIFLGRKHTNWINTDIQIYELMVRRFLFEFIGCNAAGP